MKKISIIINSDIGKKGTVGYRCLDLIKKLEEGNQLNKVLCRDNFYKKSTRIKTLYPLGSFIPKIFTGIYYYITPKFSSVSYNNNIFDNLAYSYVKKNSKEFKNNIVLVYDPCLKTIKYLKELNCKIVLDIQMSKFEEFCEFIKEKNFQIYQNDKNYYDFQIKEFNKINKKNFYFIQKEVFETVDKIIFPSEFSKESFSKDIQNKKSCIVPFGVNINEYNKIKKKKNKLITFSFLGSIEDRKGVLYLLKAWNELNLKNAELILGGRITPKYKNLINEKNIIYSGYTDPKVVLSKTDIFVFPSLLEGSAKVNYEAMAAKCTVITTMRSGPILKDKFEGVIIDFNSEKELIENLKKEMLELYTNKILREKYANNAHKKVQKYTWENYSKNILKEILK